MACNCNQNSTKTKVREAVRTGVRKALQENKREEKVRGIVREALQELLSEDGDDYQEFVQGVMETLNIDDPQDLTEEGRSEFFDMIGRNYDEETDTADDIPMEDIKSVMSPEHYEDKSKCPDFLKKDEQVREAVRNALRNLIK